MHEAAHVEEHVVEGLDRQAASLIGVLHGYDGCVERVSQVAEAWAACLDHLLGALQRKRRRRKKMMRI